MSGAEFLEEVVERTARENDQASSACSTENPFEDEIKAKEEEYEDEEEEIDENLLVSESAKDWLMDQNSKDGKLSDKEIKRQHTIYDLYDTEKRYCLTLSVFKRTYFDAVIFNQLLTLDQSLRLIPDIQCLDNLIRTHLRLLKSIKRRKIDRIEEVFLYHEIYSNGYYKNLTFDDCLLLIAQRLSKYHQLIETDYNFMSKVLEAEKVVKNLVQATDAGVGEIQMRELRRHIIQNFDHKSMAEYGVCGRFTINDLNSEIRTLLHTFQVQWSNAKGSSANVTLLIFSDVLVFVRKTSNGAYAFFSQDKKCSVVSLKKMHVTDKAGKQSGVYLIASHPKAEMYEVKCKTKKENQKLIDRVKRASDQFSESVLEQLSVATVSSNTLVTTSEENWSGNELEVLDSLFEKFSPINDKLAEYYNELFNFYGEIGSYAKTIASKVTNDDDRDEILDIVNKGFNAQTLALKNIEG
uniref:DH domain-containing protein n=1 Tax=Romanomermis culicivorax TaxID=13658 RepID=A0A915HIS4_ROMCU